MRLWKLGDFSLVELERKRSELGGYNKHSYRVQCNVCKSAAVDIHEDIHGDMLCNQWADERKCQNSYILVPHRHKYIRYCLYSRGRSLNSYNMIGITYGCNTHHPKPLPYNNCQIIVYRQKHRHLSSYINSIIKPTNPAMSDIKVNDAYNLQEF